LHDALPIFPLRQRRAHRDGARPGRAEGAVGGAPGFCRRSAGAAGPHAARGGPAAHSQRGGAAGARGDRRVTGPRAVDPPRHGPGGRRRHRTGAGADAAPLRASRRHPGAAQERRHPARRLAAASRPAGRPAAAGALRRLRLEGENAPPRDRGRGEGGLGGPPRLRECGGAGGPLSRSRAGGAALLLRRLRPAGGGGAAGRRAAHRERSAGAARGGWRSGTVRAAGPAGPLGRRDRGAAGGRQSAGDAEKERLREGRALRLAPRGGGDGAGVPGSRQSGGVESRPMVKDRKDSKDPSDRVARIVVAILIAVVLLAGAVFPDSPRAFQVIVFLGMLYALWETGARLCDRLVPDWEPLSRAVAAFTFAVGIAVVPATWMGHFGVLRPAPFLVWTAAAYLLSRLLPGSDAGAGTSPAPRRSSSRLDRIETALLLAAALAVALAGLREIRGMRFTPPGSYDDLSYHLSAVATWIRHGDLRMVRFSMGDPS